MTRPETSLPTGWQIETSNGHTILKHGQSSYVFTTAMDAAVAIGLFWQGSLWNSRERDKLQAKEKAA